MSTNENNDIRQLGVDLQAAADAANRAASFEPMTNEDERPMITVGGVHVTVYVDPASRYVRVSVDLDDTEPWLLRGDHDSTVPLRIEVGDGVTFEG